MEGLPVLHVHVLGRRRVFSLLFFRTVEPAERVLLIGRPSGLADQREVDQVVLLINVRSLVPLLRPRLSLFSPGVPSPSHVPT